MEAILKINELDNVAVAISPLFKGDIVTVGDTTYTLLTDVPAGHKMALKDIKKEEKIIKYGYPIGA
ncbi:MAG: UxaA family hydrolase, partial [Spirochaetales bacterium]|nr:UxaA family hydrolase [Spirochaetales bacterium]